MYGCSSIGLPEITGPCGEPHLFYPIQTMCEQADFCKQDRNTSRLGQLYRSAEYHKDRYSKIDYDFILEHLQSVLDEIQNEKRKIHALRKLNSD